MRVQLSIAFVALILVGLLILLLRRAFSRRAREGEALVVTGPGGKRRVSFTSAVVVPLVHRACTLNTTVQALDVVPDEDELLETKDKQLLDYRARVYIYLPRRAEDVLRAANRYGCKRASDAEAMMRLLRPELVSMLRTIAVRMNRNDVKQQREKLQEEVTAELSNRLQGFVVERTVVDQIKLADIDSDRGPFR
jgi:uncharacterized membrane protein YqiK